MCSVTADDCRGKRGSVPSFRPPIFAESRLRLSPHTVTHTLDDAVALLDVNAGAYYTIDEPGIVLVEMCREGATLGKVAERLAREYEVEEEEALGDMIELAEELLEAGLCEVVEGCSGQERRTLRKTEDSDGDTGG